MAVRKVNVEVPDELKGLSNAKFKLVYIGSSVYQMSELTYQDFETCGAEIADLIRSVLVKVLSTGAEQVSDADEFAERVRVVLTETGILARIVKVILRGVDEKDLKEATLSQLIDVTTKFQELTFSSLTKEARSGLQIVLSSFVSFLTSENSGE